MPELVESQTSLTMKEIKHIFKHSPLYQTCINTQRQSYDSMVNKTGKQVCKGVKAWVCTVNGRVVL